MRQRETVSVYAKGCPPVFKTDRLISVSSRFLLPMGGKVLLSPLVPSSPLTSPILLLQLFGPRNNGESWHHDCKMFQFSFQQAFTSFFVWCSVCVCIWFWMFSAIKFDISFFFFNFVQHFFANISFFKNNLCALQDILSLFCWSHCLLVSSQPGWLLWKRGCLLEQAQSIYCPCKKTSHKLSIWVRCMFVCTCVSAYEVVCMHVW